MTNSLSVPVIITRLTPRVDANTSQLSPWYTENVAPEWNELRNRAMEILQSESELLEIVQLVGSDALPENQQVTLEVARMIREIFLQQNSFHPVDTYCSFDKQYKLMKAILRYADLADAAVQSGAEVTAILTVDSKSELAKIKYEEMPIDTKKVKRIAVIGENAVTKMALGGVGAGVKTRCEITPLEGLQAILGNQTKITYVPGYKSFDRESRSKRFNPIRPADRELMAEAVEAARNADLVIFFAGDNREVETEGSDRKTITLPSGQDELVNAIAKVNKRLVTIIVSGGPVDVSTVRDVSAALVASWFNGSMGGQALAEVLSGKISPSGKLPMTWPKRLEDVPAYATGTYPQTIENNSQSDIFVDLTRNRSNERRQLLIADYAEQDLVGYRWYEQKQVAPAYPFGYGLSYATFEYSNLNVKHTAEGFDVSFTLTNTSDRDAEEVAQVYISRLIKELKGFRRVALKAGERKVVTIPIRRSDLCHWNEAIQAWRLEPDDITILVGSSSDNLPLTSKNEIK